ncbi:probable Small nuclear ribonucleoprotein Sm D3 [Saccharomycodes ludwigii]|uniref:Small nuclear ribonucleoprotein Sm D3 n=1 Tax=Saccharomycodes ludwigii TaxID=36035 RepID=A0A376B3Z9_9ASCO|nr:hypothetical protein SCDLUD_001800 [Saccharomycodes ludwigii]KAH3902012.1 hypothetical protein SCDLUD_001800 [Saccharomycodes ludwigii]SSD59416.1 probable Small nuclear ribonucleoprotein Sm D3 [Saccharomycodes ludwigii]
MSSNSIPIKLLNEAQGHIVSLELENGETYKGKLLESEDNMNIQLQDCIVTGRDNQQITHMDHVFIRGSNVRFIVVPDMLQHAPMFKKKSKLESKPIPPVRGSKRS